MAIIKENHLVTKRNILNELRANSMTLQELRFFSIYLSKINPSDISTRIVRFPLEDFKSIMELGRINIDYMKQVTNGLLCKVANIPLESGGYEGFQLFKKCRVDKDEAGEWYIEINAHDDALPLMFEYKERYFSYQLWNTLRLKSPKQIRMYEVLKQYEKIGERLFTIQELREMLFIGKKEYERFVDFKKRVLDSCQEALSEHTDICFTYEPHGKKGRSGKILALKFIIKKNSNFVDQLTLDEFIVLKRQEQPDILLKNYSNIEQSKHAYEDETDTYIDFYCEACDNEFSNEEIQVLHDLLKDIVPGELLSTERYNYLRGKYHEMQRRKPKQSRFGYLRTIIEAEIDK